MSDSGLVQQPFNKYWDNPPTRRELQRALNKMSANDSELAGMADTAALVLNYICEVHLKVKKEDIDVYVEAKKLQLAEARAKMKAAGATSEQPS